MNRSDLSVAEQEIMFAAISSILNDNWIDDFEFQTRLGLYRSDFKILLDAWPETEYISEDLLLAANNSLNELLNGVSVSPVLWEKHFRFSESEARHLLSKLSAEFKRRLAKESTASPDAR